MRGVWLILIAGLVGAVGCTPTPKREMRQPTKEELVGPPEGAYVTPPAAAGDSVEPAGPTRAPRRPADRVEVVA